MSEIEDPVIQSRRLRTALRAARAEAGLTQREVATALDWSVSKIVRIENGETGISTISLRALLEYYGVVDEARISSLVKLARMSRRQLLTPYKDIFPRSFVTYLGLEATASYLRSYEPTVIPGLLQTEDYATAVVGAARGISSPDSVTERMVQVRLERQGSLERLERKFSFVVDEAVLRRRVGSSRVVMERQFDCLLEVAARPNISVRVIPFSAGAYISIGTPFVYLEFPGPGDDDLVYLENSQGGDVFRESTEDTRRHLEVFLTLEDVAAPPDELTGFVDKALSEMADS